MTSVPTLARRLRIAPRFTLVVAGLLLVIAGVVVVAATGIRQMSERTREINRHVQTMELVTRLALQLSEAEATALRLTRTFRSPAEPKGSGSPDGDATRSGSVGVHRGERN